MLSGANGEPVPGVRRRSHLSGFQARTTFELASHCDYGSLIRQSAPTAEGTRTFQGGANQHSIPQVFMSTQTLFFSYPFAILFLLDIFRSFPSGVTRKVSIKHKLTTEAGQMSNMQLMRGAADT